MKFKPGKVIKEFKVGDKKVVFRYPKASDVKGLLKYINTLVKEKCYIGKQKEISLKDERKFLKETLQKMEKGTTLFMVVEIGGKISGGVNAEKKAMDATSHVGTIGIGLNKEYRGLGIGKVMLDEICRLMKKEMKLKLAELSYYQWNEVSKELYTKYGFREIGRIPKGVNYYGEYGDEILMVKEL